MTILIQSRFLSDRHLSTNFLDPVLRVMNQVCRQLSKFLTSDWLVGIRLGLLNFLTPVCMDWLFWLFAFGKVQVVACFG